MISSRGNDSGFILLDALLFLILVTIILVPLSRVSLDLHVTRAAVVHACLERFGVESRIGSRE